MNALIIGGSSDIGIRLAKYLISNGYNVTITYNHHNDNLDFTDNIHLDVRDSYEIDKVIKEVTDKYKKIDILINMASISRDNDFFSATKEDFTEVLLVNLVGMFLCNQIYSKYNHNGLIINFASTDGIDTFSKYSTFYAASKAGIINMSKSIAMSVDNKVLCVCPNWIDSDSTRGMDMEYLESELVRIGQSRLITIDELNDSIYKIINMNEKSGSVFRIDIKGDKLWIEKI